jgi:hypothetical protein
MNARKIVVPAVSAAALMAGAVFAAPPADTPANPLQPMAFLAGHCYKGTVRGNDTDEHCFAWKYDGMALRDVHTVKTPGKPDYVGETTYYYDSAAKRIEYLYIENAGGVMRGTVEPADGALVFPATTYVAGGQSMTLRVRWTLQGTDAYEALSEMQNKGQWVTMFKAKMAKSL